MLAKAGGRYHRKGVWGPGQISLFKAPLTVQGAGPQLLRLAPTQLCKAPKSMRPRAVALICTPTKNWGGGGRCQSYSYAWVYRMNPSSYLCFAR